MPTPQPGVLPAGGAHAYFLTFAVAEGAERAALSKAIRDILPSVRALATKAKRARLLCTLGIGSELWDRLSPARRPAGLRPFRAVNANGRVVPATGGDTFLQITSARHDLNLDLAMGLARRLQPFATMTEEIHGFRYRDSRDLTGFIDGTENPKGEGQGCRSPDWRRGSAVCGRQLRRGPAVRS